MMDLTSPSSTILSMAPWLPLAMAALSSMSCSVRALTCANVSLMSTLRVLPSASEFSWLMTSVSVWIRPAIRLFSLRARAIETCCFIVSPEEILHHCVHSSVPFGVAGRLTAKV